jgi:tRNA (guanine10-N2)-methyltransferase
MEKVTQEEYSAPKFGLEEIGDEYAPAHKNFRDKYFKGFRKDEEVDGDTNGEKELDTT